MSACFKCNNPRFSSLDQISRKLPGAHRCEGSNSYLQDTGQE